MPKSRRDRPGLLSRTKKKGKEQKKYIVNGINEAVEKFDSVYVFPFDNMRNSKIKAFREQLQPRLRGDTGLFLTNISREEVESLFNTCEDYDFARTGSIAAKTNNKVLKEGPLEQFTHEMEPFSASRGCLFV